MTLGAAAILAVRTHTHDPHTVRHLSHASESSIKSLSKWSRRSGPALDLDWLQGGRLTEDIPGWFVDFFVSTRDVGAVRPGQTDNCTMTTLEDNWCLYRLAQMIRPARSLEIGIMRGSSSITIGKAFVDAGIDCIQTAVDIDPAAAEAASKHFRTYGLHSKYVPIVADSREWIRTSPERWQFVFLDGDHHYDTVALEFAEAFNRTDPDGVIILHDTGSALWGTSEDPGMLFFDVLDAELGEAAEMTWLDSTSCSADMRLRTSLGLHSTLPPISAAIAVGYGGLGIVRKVNESKRMSAERLLDQRPAHRPVYFEPMKPASPVRRAARRVASMLGI